MMPRHLTKTVSRIGSIESPLPRTDVDALRGGAGNVEIASNEGDKHQLRFTRFYRSAETEQVRLAVLPQSSPDGKAAFESNIAGDLLFGNTVHERCEQVDEYLNAIDRKCQLTDGSAFVVGLKELLKMRLG